MSINKLIKGYQNFYHNYKADEEHLLRKLSNSQTPSTVIIACSDSRVDPAMITNANYGDIFVIRNIANIVPPNLDTHDSHHGTSSALEYAVSHLNVDNLIVMGHSNCGGIKALLNTDFETKDSGFIQEWLKIIKDVKDKTPDNLTDDEKLHFCEKESIKQSLENAKTFDFIKEKHDTGKLKILGWYFDLESGKMYQYDEGIHDFIDLSTHEI